MGTIEIIATILTLGCVWLARTKKVITWPLGILGALVYSWIFLETKLYADMVLQFFYVGMGIWGWFTWNKENDEITPKKIGIDQAIKHLALLWGFFVIITLSLENFTDSHHTYWDVGLTLLSLLANYYLIKQYRESWLLWMVVNVGYIILMYKSELYYSVILYVILLGVAMNAFFKWNKELSYVK